MILTARMAKQPAGAHTNVAGCILCDTDRTGDELLLLPHSLCSHSVTLNTNKVKEPLRGDKRTDVETPIKISIHL